MPDAQQEWEVYRARELAQVTPILNDLGYELDSVQPQTGGERYFFQAVTTAHGKKLILFGRRRSDGRRVVLKTTSDSEGIRELESERDLRRLLGEINFAYGVFLSPEELYFARHGAHTIAAYAFIDQESSFLARSLLEQFALALKAFKAQESAHATAYGHARLIRRAFETANCAWYLRHFAEFKKNLEKTHPELAPLLARGEAFLREHAETIEQYGGFLTHTDFVPHNFRIKGGEIYLLDHSSLRFGNKYEGWARFVNFMALYNPPLEQALIDYVRLNRTPEESLALKLMRVYRLGEIIWYYVRTLEHVTGDQRELNAARVSFWTEVLKAVLADRQIAPGILETYRATRDHLRSPDELLRQQGLH